MNLNIFELDELLMHIETIFDGWHSDGTAWSEWDEKVRQRLLDFRTKYTYRTQGQKWQEMVKAGEVSEDTVPLRHYAQLCEIADKKNQQILALKKQVEDLEFKLNNAEHYAAKKELEVLRISQTAPEGREEAEPNKKLRDEGQ